MRVAIVHDWLTVYGGAEKVLKEIIELFPTADLFSVVDFFPKNLRQHLLFKQAKTTFIQKLPFAKQIFRHYLFLMPLAIEQLDVTGYDLVLSSSYAVAKGVITAPDQVHLCYCHTPIRYAWDQQFQYLKRMKGMKKLCARWMLHHIRLWDVRTANNVDHFIANSHFVAKRIQKTYGRFADVVYPPVSLSSFPLQKEKEDFYVTASRLVAYKNVDLIVEAFKRMPARRLFVIGEGPEYKRLARLCSSNVTLLGYQSQEELASWLGRARAFIFAAVEDFGIAPVEAQGCGTPVIAYGRGGVVESVNGLDDENPTGCFYMEQSPEAICNAIEEFENQTHRFSPEACRQNAERFSEKRFQDLFLKQVNNRFKHENYPTGRRKRNPPMAHLPE